MLQVGQERQGVNRHEEGGQGWSIQLLTSQGLGSKVNDGQGCDE